MGADNAGNPDDATVEADVEALCSGDRSALARVLTVVEQGGRPAREVGRLVHERSGRAYTVGITGAPGAGKSTLTSALLTEMRAQEIDVAVLAIDPTSPFSGGAILGDRVRMGEHVLDDGVFIRSMATRGHLGGLASATPQAVRVLDAAGYEWVLIETVGVGQVEVEVAGAADTTVVVVNPGWGDAIQANKAGLMEIADLFVINKADRPGVEDTRRDLEQMMDLTGFVDWRPPIVATTATLSEGVEDLWRVIGEHRRHCEGSGLLEERRQRRLEAEVDRIVAERLRERAAERTGDGAAVHAAVAERRLDPWSAAEELLGDS